MDIHIPSLQEIKRALHIQETIETLKNELSSIFGGAETGVRRGRKPGRKPGRPGTSSGVGGGDGMTSTKRTEGKAAKRKRTMSPESREKIAAAQRKRWAKQKKVGEKAALAGER